MNRGVVNNARTRAIRICILALVAALVVVLGLVTSLQLTTAYAAPEDDGGTTTTTDDGGTTNTDEGGSDEGGDDFGDDGISTASLGDVSDAILEQLAEEQNIYPGTVGEDGVWTVYDTGNADTATIKATVTLPDTSAVGENTYLYIREVQQDESYYPQDGTLKDAVRGEWNDMQCYAIHWVTFEQVNGEWTYRLQTDSVLGDGTDDDAPTATVEIEYVNLDTYGYSKCLQGSQAHRKLQVYNSRDTHGTVLEENATPVDVTATDDAYTSFTFETNRGGPYVFVSKKLPDGYVAEATVSSITDGTAPFDSSEGDGNDTGEHNGTVRSFDQITYDVSFRLGARSVVSTESEIEVRYQVTLDVDVTDAIFDLQQMNWLEDNYEIEYLDKEGNVLYTQNSDGVTEASSGKTIELSSFLNEIASGSNEGAESYSTDIASQRLTGWETRVGSEDNNNVLASTYNKKFGIQVLSAKNGDKIQPVIKAWVAGNEDNYGSESKGTGDDVQLAPIMEGNEVTPNEVTVSAAARFNLELAENANVSYKGWFDNSSGKEISASNDDKYDIGGTVVTAAQLYELLEKLAALEENEGRANPEEYTDEEGACSSLLNGKQLSDYKDTFENIRYGRITGYGTTLQVYNNSDDKGFKGISLPQGEITFDLELSNSVKINSGSPEETQYYSVLWEYNENVSSETGNQGKNMYWALLGSTRYAAWAAPYNSGGSDTSCYQGGTWAPGSSGLGQDGAYHFSVSGFDFNLLTSGITYPTHKAGNASATTGYNDYIGCFSAGYIQVLNVMPRYQAGSLNLYTNVTVKNLSVTTVGNQSISVQEGDQTGYAHETNTGDNALRDEIPLYAKGGMTKANAFCNAATFDEKNSDFTSSKYFLGTDFWSTSYDCSAFAGQRITLVGAARINAGDYKIKHMNMLQLFDSEVLSVTEGKTPYVISKVTDADTGEQTILYAADPDYKDGYDTNNSDVMAYMNTVREEDLIYFTSLEDLEEAGYTCVGVLAELRGCDISGEGGYSTVFKIAMDVSEEEDCLRKTVGTVNTVRIWTNADDMTIEGEDGESKYVSWADGANNPNEEKNSVAGYTSVYEGDDDHYRGEVANGSGSEAYTKTEYEDGQIKFGTNTNGYVYGSSLLVLGYKSEVVIGVDNGGEGAQSSFSMDRGETTVEYHLSNIIAKREESIGQGESPTTNLTVLVKLDTAREDEGAQRIAVSADSYEMVPSSTLMKLVDENNSPLEDQAVQISSDPDNPTTVRYAMYDESGNMEGVYTIEVYAVVDTNGSQVTFEIKGATVDVSVPDITYEALIDTNEVNDNDTIQATAYISGTDDVRAYATTNGNMSTTSIGIIKQFGTSLVKKVEQRYIELDGLIDYTVTYTNNGANPVESIYLYDLLPNTSDSRGSHFGGTAILRALNANPSGGTEEARSKTKIVLYYSTTEYAKLYDEVKLFGADAEGGEKSEDGIEELLSDREYFHEYGTIEGDGTLKRSEYLENLCTVDGTFSDEKLTEEMSKVTGIYAVVTDLEPNVSLNISLRGETDGNMAGDLYRNIADTWLGDASSGALESNRVETTVLSRAINGVVWEDVNLNGVRDDGEPTTSGVTCTLFRLDEGTGQYVQVTEDIRGDQLAEIVTGSDGAYSFENLPEGEYIVAFSGDDVLDDYTGATIYRVNEEDDDTSNDAVALFNSESGMDTEASLPSSFLDVGTYKYAIAYSLTGDEGAQTVGSTSLHSISDIVNNNIQLTNNVELYDHLDFGLVRAGYKLPETGGVGHTWFYLAGGVLLIGSACGLAMYRHKRKACVAGAVEGKVR